MDLMDMLNDRFLRQMLIEDDDDDDDIIRTRINPISVRSSARSGSLRRRSRLQQLVFDDDDDEDLSTIMRTMEFPGDLTTISHRVSYSVSISSPGFHIRKTVELERRGFCRGTFDYGDVLELIYNDRSSSSKHSRNEVLSDLRKMRQRYEEGYDNDERVKRNSNQSNGSEELRKLREYRRKANEAFDNMERKVRQQ